MCLGRSIALAVKAERARERESIAMSFMVKDQLTQDQPTFSKTYPE